jgi:hypothetical protein
LSENCNASASDASSSVINTRFAASGFGLKTYYNQLFMRFLGSNHSARYTPCAITLVSVNLDFVRVYRNNRRDLKITEKQSHHFGGATFGRPQLHTGGASWS